jgi:hypothetical protein
MTKPYIIVGSNWCACVPIENTENLSENQTQIEAATRGVEAHLKKRKDIVIEYGYSLPSQNDEWHDILVKIITTELKENCGIGGMLCIMDKNIVDGNTNEWYINSKHILQNVGCPELIKAYDEKYPDKNHDICFDNL